MVKGVTTAANGEFDIDELPAFGKLKLKISAVGYKEIDQSISFMPDRALGQMKLNLIDEYQFCVHPVTVGNGLPLFENINDRTILKLIKTKIFSSGAVTFTTNGKTNKNNVPLTRGLCQAGRRAKFNSSSSIKH